MAQLISCPACKKQLQVPDELLGKTVQCPECGHMFIGAAMATEPMSDSRPRPEPRTYDDDKAPQKSRYDDGDDNEIPNLRRSSGGRRGGEKPGKVAGLGIMALIGGIFAILLSLSLGISLGAMTCGLFCLWPGTYYSLIIGILATIKGAALMGDSAATQSPPIATAVMLIINIINGDFVGLTLGIIMLVFCSDQEVKDYLAK